MSTIKDVAKLAGVSPSTVSRVVNSGSTSVSSKTSEKIWNAVRETGYSVNETARNLRKPDGGEKAARRNSQAIDCIFARDIDAFVDPFFMALMHIIEAEVFKHGYQLRYQYAISEYKNLLSSNNQKKDAAIILGRIDQLTLNKLEKVYRHLVYVGLQDKRLAVDSVICSGYDATVMGIEYLISIGHKKICYLGETHDEQRYDAYLDVMKAHSADGCEPISLDVKFTPSDSYEKLKLALEQGLDCTAIFCANDISAFGVLRILREKHIRVPGDISIVGLNDIESVRYLDPMLTTVHVPLEEMGKHAAKLLIDRVEGEHRVHVKTLFPSELVLRDSCSKYKGKK